MCRTCFSKISLDDCEAKATEETCEEPTPVCMMYQTTARKGPLSKERHIRYCTSMDLLKTLQDHCAKEPVEIPSLGVVTCRAYTDFCTEESCLARV